MRETRRRLSITRSSRSGSGPPGVTRASRCSTRSSNEGCPCIGSMLSHQSVTRVSLEKKRCPPMSILFPAYCTVFEMPPMRVSSSNMVTRYASGCSSSSYAAVNPAGPAPIITTYVCLRCDILSPYTRCRATNERSPDRLKSLASYHFSGVKRRLKREFTRS